MGSEMCIRDRRDGARGGAHGHGGEEGVSGPLGLDPASFVPRPVVSMADARARGGGDAGGSGGVGGARLVSASGGIDADPGQAAALLDALLTPGTVQRPVLALRLTALRALGAFWAQGDVRGAMAHLGKLGDAAVVADFLRAGGLRRCASHGRRALPRSGCSPPAARRAHSPLDPKPTPRPPQASRP